MFSFYLFLPPDWRYKALPTRLTGDFLDVPGAFKVYEGILRHFTSVTEGFRVAQRNFSGVPGVPGVFRSVPALQVISKRFKALEGIAGGLKGNKRIVEVISEAFRRFKGIPGHSRAFKSLLGA